MSANIDPEIRYADAKNAMFRAHERRVEARGPIGRFVFGVLDERAVHRFNDAQRQLDQAYPVSLSQRQAYPAEIPPIVTPIQKPTPQ